MWISKGVCIHTVCNKGGDGIGFCREQEHIQTDKYLPPSTFTGKFSRKADIYGLVFLQIFGPPGSFRFDWHYSTDGPAQFSWDSIFKYSAYASISDPSQHGFCQKTNILMFFSKSNFAWTSLEKLCRENFYFFFDRYFSSEKISQEYIFVQKNKKLEAKK